jgi:hypothetical protein
VDQVKASEELTGGGQLHLPAEFLCNGLRYGETAGKVLVQVSESEVWVTQSWEGCLLNRQ